MPRAVPLIRLCLAVALLASFPRLAMAADSAVVRGASSLNVRSGPGREFSSFATLQEGNTVEVETVEGSWARIRTPQGETGYVHKAFLDIVAPRPAAPPAETPAPERVPEEAEAPAAPADVAESEPTQVVGPDEDMLTGQKHLEALVESLQKDVKRLLTEVEGMQRGPLAAPPPTPVRISVTGVDAAESGSLLGLCIIGLVAGFILGAIYGRRQERGRRTRVRF